MNMQTLAAQALEAAKKIAPANATEAELTSIAFKLACAIAAECSRSGK